MKNIAFQNLVLQRDRVLERRVLEREYCAYLSRLPKIPNFRTLENHVKIKLGSCNVAKLVYHC
jgi:hypothetical protein